MYTIIAIIGLIFLVFLILFIIAVRTPAPDYALNPYNHKWRPCDLVTYILDELHKHVKQLNYGPFIVTLGGRWVPFIYADYSSWCKDTSLLDRLCAIELIHEIKIDTDDTFLVTIQ